MSALPVDARAQLQELSTKLEAWGACRADDIAQLKEQRLEDVRSLFRKWFGQLYDTDILNTVLAAAASHWLDGDPIWLLVIGGPGDAKTETISTLESIVGTERGVPPVHICD